MPGLEGLLGGLVALYVVLLALAVLYPVALIYVALRVRDARETTPDPKLGMKTAFHTLHTTAVLLALTGASIITVDLMSGKIKPKQPAPAGPFGPPPAAAKNDDGFNAAKRVGAGLIASGVLFGLAFWGFLVGAGDGKRKAVRRVFVGGRMALSLLIVLFSTTALIVIFLQKEPPEEATEVFLGLLMVWVPAAGVHIGLFNINSKADGDGTLDLDDEDDHPRHPRGRF